MPPKRRIVSSKPDQASEVDVSVEVEPGPGSEPEPEPEKSKNERRWMDFVADGEVGELVVPSIYSEMSNNFDDKYEGNMDIKPIIEDIIGGNEGSIGESVVKKFLNAINEQEIIRCLISKLIKEGQEKIIWMNPGDLIIILKSCLGYFPGKLLGILLRLFQERFDLSKPLYQQLSEFVSIGHLIIYIDRNLEQGNIKGSLKNIKKHKKKRKYKKTRKYKKKRKYKNKLSKKKNKYRSKIS